MLKKRNQKDNSKPKLKPKLKPKHSPKLNLKFGINKLQISKLRWTCQETNKSEPKQREYKIIPKITPKLTSKKLLINVPILRIPFDHEIRKTSNQNFYNLYLSFDTYQGIKPLSKCNLNNNANTNANYKAVFYHKIQELDKHIKRTLSNNSKKMFKRSLSYQEVNDLYVHSIIKEYYQYAQSDLFHIILPCQKLNPKKPDCLIYNSTGKKSRASIQRILRRGSKLQLTIQLKYVIIKLPPKNVAIGKLSIGSTSSKRIDNNGLLRYSKHNTGGKKYYIRPKWEIKSITIDKLSNRKTNNVEPSTVEPLYAFLSDSE